MRLLVRLHPVGLGDGGCRCALREGVGGLLIRGPLSWLPPVYWVKL